MSQSTESSSCERGMSLVEVLIAVVILTVGLFGFARVALSSKWGVDSSLETTVVAAELQTSMESLLSMQIEQMPISGSAFAAGVPIAITENRLPELQVVASYPGFVAGAPVPNPLAIVLTASWRSQQGRTRTLRLETVEMR